MSLPVTVYFSRFPEMIKLATTTSSSTCHLSAALKSLFSRYGIPSDNVISDNHGPQYIYASQEFCDFAKEYDFKHTTSSPHFPQSNGHAESAVQTAKNLLKASKDPHICMSSLSYQSECEFYQGKTTNVYMS